MSARVEFEWETQDVRKQKNLSQICFNIVLGLVLGGFVPFVTFMLLTGRECLNCSGDDIPQETRSRRMGDAVSNINRSHPGHNVRVEYFSGASVFEKYHEKSIFILFADDKPISDAVSLIETQIIADKKLAETDMVRNIKEQHLVVTSTGVK